MTDTPIEGAVARRRPRTAARARADAGRSLVGGAALALLDDLARARFLTPAQAARLTQPDDPRPLFARLRRAGLVRSVPYRPEVRAPLGYVFCLTPLGARAAVARASDAAGEGGAADPDLARRARHLAADALSELFLAHHLGVSDLYVAVAAAATAPFAWRSGEEARIAFRSFAARDGRGVLVPDAVAAPSTLGPGEDALARGGVALELDRATMGRAAIERKLLRYRECIADRGRFGPVLFVAAEPARRRWLETRLRAAGIEGAALAGDAAAAAVVAALAGLGPDGDGAGDGDAAVLREGRRS